MKGKLLKIIIAVVLTIALVNSSYAAFVIKSQAMATDRSTVAASENAQTQSANSNTTEGLSSELSENSTPHYRTTWRHNEHHWHSFHQYHYHHHHYGFVMHNIGYGGYGWVYIGPGSLGVVSFCWGIVSIIPLVGLVFGPAAIIGGLVARGKKERLSRAAIILGAIGLCISVIALLVILAL